LICDGETTEYDSISEQKTSKKSSEDVVITDTYLRYQGLKYYKGTDFDRDTKAEYFAHYDGVSFSTLHFEHILYPAFVLEIRGSLPTHL
jgi:hypothetical protein